MLLVNLSGHPAPRGSEAFAVCDVPVANVPVSARGVAAAATDLLGKVLAAHREEVMRGEYQVLLPGMTPLAAAVLALLHGVAGHFPAIRFAVKGETGFRLSEPMDLQALRTSAREIR